MKLRRTFTSGFKLETASLVFDEGYLILQANCALDIEEIALRHW